jgi:hypothetical protein
MTNQEVFDKVALHLLDYYKRGKKSSINSENHVVRCLIPDEIYNPTIERHTMIFLYSNLTGGLREICNHLEVEKTDRFHLLSSLQGIHDVDLKTDGSGKDITESLRRIAKRYSLSDEVLNGCV